MQKKKKMLMSIENFKIAANHPLTCHGPPFPPFAAYGPPKRSNGHLGSTWPTLRNPDIDKYDVATKSIFTHKCMDTNRHSFNICTKCQHNCCGLSMIMMSEETLASHTTRKRTK